MKKRLTPEERQILIDNCGKTKITQKNRSLERTKRVVYCGYYYGEPQCEKCRKYEKNKRADIVKNHLYGAVTTFVCTVQDDENNWQNLRRKLSRENINYIRVPQSDGTSILVTDGDPNYKDFLFIETPQHEATSILTTEENLFVDVYDSGGKKVPRSSSPTWSLTQTKTEEEDGIEIEHLYAVFENGGENWLVSSFVIDQLSLVANTWNGGEVGEDNAQAFVTHGDSLYIEMHCAAGWTYNKDKSFIRTQKHSLESIQQWKARHRTIAEDVIYGRDENGVPYDVDSFCGAKDKLYAVLMGDIPVIDRLAELKQYKEDKRLREELGLAYDLFYPQHQYDEVEQAEIDKVVVY